MADEESWYLLFGLVGFQAAIWAYLYWIGGPIRGTLQSWLERPGNEDKRESVKTNDVPEREWSFWICVMIHHGLGGGIALIGLCLSGSWSVLLVRIGVSFEIGEDVLHVVQMIWTMLCPPGSELFGELFPTVAYRFAMMLHHMIGLVGGTFVFVYIPDWWEAQFIIVILLLAALPMQIPYPFMPFVNFKAKHLPPVGKFACGLIIVGQGTAFFFRLALFPWVAVLFLGRLDEAGYGQGIRNTLVFVAVAFVLFSCVGLAYHSGKLVTAAKQLCGCEVVAEGEENPMAKAISALEGASSFTNPGSRRSFSSAKDSKKVELQQGNVELQS